MKKLLALLSAVVITSSTATSVVSCFSDTSVILSNGKDDSTDPGDGGQIEESKFTTKVSENDIVLDKDGNPTGEVTFTIFSSNNKDKINKVSLLSIEDGSTMDNEHYAKYFNFVYEDNVGHLTIKDKDSAKHLPLGKTEGMVFSFGINYDKPNLLTDAKAVAKLNFGITNNYVNGNTDPIEPPIKDDANEMASTNLSINQTNTTITINKDGNISNPTLFTIKNNSVDLTIDNVSLETESSHMSDDLRRYKDLFTFSTDDANNYVISLNNDSVAKLDQANIKELKDLDFTIKLTGKYKTNNPFDIDLNAFFSVINNHKIPEKVDVNKLVKDNLSLTQSTDSITIDKNGNTTDMINFNVKNNDTDQITVNSVRLESDDLIKTDDLRRYGDLFTLTNKDNNYSISLNKDSLSKLDKDQIKQLKGLDFNINISGTATDQKTNFSIDLNVKFDLINNHEIPAPEDINQIVKDNISLTQSTNSITINEDGLTTDSINFTVDTKDQNLATVSEVSLENDQQKQTDDFKRFGQLFTLTNKDNVYSVSLNDDSVKKLDDNEIKQLKDINFAIKISGAAGTKKEAYSTDLNIHFDLTNNHKIVVPPTNEEIEKEINTKVSLAQNTDKFTVDENNKASSILITPTITNKDIDTSKISVENLAFDETKSDDTNKYSKFFDLTKSGNDYNLTLKDENSINALLANNNSEMHFVFGLTVKYDNKEFVLTKDIKFTLIINRIVKEDLQKAIDAVITKPIQLEDIDRTLVIQDELESELEIAIEHNLTAPFRDQYKVLDEANKETQYITLIANDDSKLFKGYAKIKFNYAPDPKIIPTLNNGVYDMGSLYQTDIYSFINEQPEEQRALIQSSFEQKYREELGADIASRFLPYFKYEIKSEDIANAENGKGTATIYVQTPFDNLPEGSTALTPFEFTLSYDLKNRDINDVIPDNIFQTELTDLKPDSPSEDIINALTKLGTDQESTLKIKDFKDNFKVELEPTTYDGETEVFKAKITSIKDPSIDNQFITNGSSKIVEYNLLLPSIKEILSTDSHSFYSGFYALMKFDFMKDKFNSEVKSKMAKGDAKDLLTIDNDYNNKNFVSSKPETWNLRVTAKGYAGYGILRPDFAQALLDIWIKGSDGPKYEKNFGGKGYFEADATYLIASNQEIRDGIMKGFNTEAGPTYQGIMKLGTNKSYNPSSSMTWTTVIEAQSQYKKYLGGVLNESLTKFHLKTLDLSSYLDGYQTWAKQNPLQMISPIGASDGDIAKEVQNKITGVDTINETTQFPKLENHLSFDIKMTDDTNGIATVKPGTSKDDSTYMTGSIIVPFQLGKVKQNNKVINQKNIHINEGQKYILSYPETLIDTFIKNKNK